MHTEKKPPRPRPRRSTTGSPQAQTVSSEIEIDKLRLESLALAQARDDEIAAVLNLDPEVLARHRKLIDNSRSRGRSLLRRKIFQLACNGDASMLRLLYRQECDSWEAKRRELDLRNAELEIKLRECKVRAAKLELSRLERQESAVLERLNALDNLDVAELHNKSYTSRLKTIDELDGPELQIQEDELATQAAQISSLQDAVRRRKAEIEAEDPVVSEIPGANGQ